MSQDSTGQDRPRPRPAVKIGIVLAVLLLGAVGAYRLFSVEHLQVPSVAMEPLLQQGQQVKLRKPGGVSRVHRGDVVAFTRAGSTERAVGRVIGEAGDVVEVQARRVKVNGTTLERVPCTPPQYTHIIVVAGAKYPNRFFSQCDQETLPGGLTYRVLFDETTGLIRPSTSPVKIPEGSVFVLGDNRDRSKDSREGGPIPLASVLGRIE